MTDNKPWPQYPTGTIARNDTGESWVKLGHRSWKHNSGRIDPGPGVDAVHVEEPEMVPDDPHVEEIEEDFGHHWWKGGMA